MNHTITLTISAFLLITSSKLAAQSVSINDNGSVAHPSAMLDVNVITATAKKGLLIPRMTSAQRTAIASPAQGLLVYDTNTNTFWFFNATAWTQLATGSAVNFWTANGTNIYNNNAGSVGIGLSAPKAKLHVAAHKTVVFGPDSLSNASGAQFVWFGKKGGLRLRRQAVTNEYPASVPYDYAQIGENSLAIGNSVASGQNTMAIGDAQAKGSQSFAQGFGAIAQGQYSFARGFGASATGNDAFVQGTSSATGDGSFAFGASVRTIGSLSFAHGSNHTVTGGSASAFGNGNSARAYNSFVIGRNNDSVSSSSSTAWVATDPLFIIGNGASTTSRSNALVVLKNAVTGIGVHPIGTTLDYGMLQIKSSLSKDNLTLIQSSTNNRWGFYVGGTGPDLNVYMNGIYKGRFDNVDGAYLQSSDRRLKKDIAPVSAVLNKVLQLKAYQYHYLENKFEDPYSHGFMAQDVEIIFPDLASRSTDKEGTELLSINYNKFSVIAIKAIQEQQVVIENQQNQIDALTKRLDALEKAVKSK